MACAATSVADDPIFALALWSMVVLDYAVEIYEGYHYSVDMWLGMVLVSLLWNVFKFIEGDTDGRRRSSGPTPTQQSISLRNVIIYSPPALVAYLQIIVLPESTANILILFYAGSAVFILFNFVWKATKETKKQIYMHYVQHILLCLLFLALALYL